MNELPQNIKDRIEKDAEKKYKAHSFGNPSCGIDYEISDSLADKREGYKTGATDQASRALPLLEALELAEVEIKAMYKRLGISNSNVLGLIEMAIKNYHQ